jgi:hypothetical protein
MRICDHSLEEPRALVLPRASGENDKDSMIDFIWDGSISQIYIFQLIFPHLAKST